MEKTKIMSLAMVLLLVSVIGVFGLLHHNTTTTSMTQNLKYVGTICAFKNGQPLGCSHNTLTNAGKNMFRDVSTNTAHNVVYLALGNTTGPSASDTSLPGELTNCGLAKASGTYTANSDGNWTISHTWTSTCSVTVNTTGLYDGSAGNLFAGGVLSSNAVMESDDNLTIQYTVSVSE